MQAHLFQRQCHNDQDSRLEDWLAQFPFLCHRHHDHRSVHLVVIASLTPSILCDSGSYIFIKIHVVIIVSQIPWGFQTWDQTLCSSTLCVLGREAARVLWVRSRHLATIPIFYFLLFRSHISTPKFLSNRNIKTQGKRWSVAHRS